MYKNKIYICICIYVYMYVFTLYMHIMFCLKLFSHNKKDKSFHFSYS